MHKLLKHQLRKFLPPEAASNLDPRFLNAISAAYEDGDAARRRLERSINLMSDEMTDLNEDLRSQKKQADKASERAESEEQRNIAKSAFLAAMSHEIRTPLNAVIGAADLLKKSSLTDEQIAHVNLLTNGGQLLLEIINDIIDLSKFEAGKVTLEERDFNPQAVMEQTIDLWYPKAQEKGLTLTLQFANNTDTEYLCGDEYRIKQILNNLISNALKFTKRGGVSVTAALEPARHGNTVFLFEVADTGIGIPLERQDAIFHPFEQADKSTTRNYGGSGLGLSIISRLAHLMGGDITLTSTPGRGSVFTVTVPMCKGEAPQTGELDVQPNSSANYPKTAFNRILIVDDIMSNRLVLSALLKPYCVCVDEVHNGKEAVAACESAAYDLIFMDYHMPVMDGLEATRAIRDSNNINADTRIVALTAEAMQEHVSQFTQAGMDYYLAKPITSEGLINCLNQVMTQPESTPVMGVAS
ncbi:MAG: ATP-binding protein [Aquisalinus sp.]|nr:ATP-binding protein [Aquisalinus sp.]